MNDLDLFDIGAAGVLIILVLRECFAGMRGLLQRRNGPRATASCSRPFSSKAS